MSVLVVVVGVLGLRAAVSRARRASRRAAALREPRRALALPAMGTPQWFVDSVEVAPVYLEVAPAWRWFLGVAAIVAVGGFVLAGPVLAVLLLASWIAAPRVAVALIRARREAAYDAVLVVGLDAMARAIRGGASLQAAVGDAAAAIHGPAGADLQRVVASVARGARLEQALAEWRASSGRASVRLTVGAVALAAKTGGPPARVIEDVAASLRMRMQVEGEARSLGAQARLSAIVVGVAPIGFALVACVVDPRNAALMFGTPIGVACLIAGLVFDVVGALWMQRISQTVLA